MRWNAAAITGTFTTLARFELPAIVLTLDYVNNNAAPKVANVPSFLAYPFFSRESGITGAA